MFYKLTLIWNALVCRRLAHIIKDLHNTTVSRFDEKINTTAATIRRMKDSTAYLGRYYFCLMLNFLNILVQFTLMHFFINNGGFFQFELDVMHFYTTSNTK